MLTQEILCPELLVDILWMALELLCTMSLAGELCFFD